MKTKAKDNRLRTFDFESNGHCGKVLTGLNHLRNRRQLFDVTLEVQGEKFQAHRVVLASCSDYFRAMFTDAMKESQQEEITLNGVTANGVKHLLDYAYTSRLTLSLGNIQDVLGAASHLQIIPVVNASSSYLLSQLDLDNAVDILTLAETYSLLDLSRMVYCFIGRNLDKLYGLPEFQRLSLSQLQHFLLTDFPIDCPEAEVLQAVLLWLHFEQERRAEFHSKLLGCVQFKHVSHLEFLTLKKTTAFKELRKRFPAISACVHRLYWQAKLLVTNEDEELNCLINPRGFEKAIVNIGGFQCHRGLTNDITYFHMSSGKWRRLTTIPHVEQCDFGVAVVDNALYVVGGCFNQSLQEHIHPFGFRYNSRSDKWTTISPMLQERCRFYMAAVGGKLYALGGIGETESFREEGTCECYDPKTDAWTEMPPLESNRTQHAGAVIGSEIYIAGGLDMGDLGLDSVMSYNADTGAWKEHAGMLSPRADHCMVANDTKLYVAGGWHEDVSTGNRNILQTIDCYDAQRDQWDTIAKVPTPRYHASLVVLNTTLYLVGGFGHGQFNRASKKIEAYNLQKGEWLDTDDYAYELWEHMSCKLFVPTCREDAEVGSDFFS